MNAQLYAKKMNLSSRDRTLYSYRYFIFSYHEKLVKNRLFLANKKGPEGRGGPTGPNSDVRQMCGDLLERAKR